MPYVDVIIDYELAEKNVLINGRVTASDKYGLAVNVLHRCRCYHDLIIIIKEVMGVCIAGICSTTVWMTLISMIVC